MRVLVAMSGGVDSSVAALLLVEEGHDVVGATMKLWGGRGDSGCCSLGDVSDARRVADHLGIDHHVFNFSEAFEERVVSSYVEAHGRGETPNPCVECNRHLKFDAFLARALRLGFDAIATGHHARVVRRQDGKPELRRGADRAKDQSYVLSVLRVEQLGRLHLPVGEMEKRAVRKLAEERGLVTAAKPDSQEVCFIPSRTTAHGREQFLRERIELHPGVVVEAGTRTRLGEVRAVELVTLGQRRGLPTEGGAAPRYVVDVDFDRREVVVGDAADLFVSELELGTRTWVDGELAPGAAVEVQLSAHGVARTATVTAGGIAFDAPARRVAKGQIAALYVGDAVVGSGVVR